MAQMILLNVYQIDGAPQSPSIQMGFPVAKIGPAKSPPVAVGNVNMYGLIGTDAFDGVFRKYSVRETIAQLVTASNA